MVPVIIVDATQFVVSSQLAISLKWCHVTMVTTIVTGAMC